MRPGRSPDRVVLVGPGDVAVEHPQVRTGEPFRDRLGLRDAEELEAVGEDLVEDGVVADDERAARR